MDDLEAALRAAKAADHSVEMQAAESRARSLQASLSRKEDTIRELRERMDQACRSFSAPALALPMPTRNPTHFPWQPTYPGTPLGFPPHHPQGGTPTRLQVATCLKVCLWEVFGTQSAASIEEPPPPSTL